LLLVWTVPLNNMANTSWATSSATCCSTCWATCGQCESTITLRMRCGAAPHPVWTRTLNRHRRMRAVVRLSAEEVGDQRPVMNRWSSPSTCSGRDCDYVAEWRAIDDTDRLSFSITAKQSTGLWTGIAFARQPKMVGPETTLQRVRFVIPQNYYYYYCGKRYLVPYRTRGKLAKTNYQYRLLY